MTFFLLSIRVLFLISSLINQSMNQGDNLKMNPRWHHLFHPPAHTHTHTHVFFCVRRWCLKSEWLCLAPTRTASSWTESLCQRKTETPLFIFHVVKMNDVLPATESPTKKRRVVVVWCVAVFFCALRDEINAATQNYRCASSSSSSSSSSKVLHSCDGLLPPTRGSRFTLMSRGWLDVLTGCPLIESGSMTRHLCVSSPSVINLSPTLWVAWGIVLLMGVCSNQSQRQKKK